MIISLVNTKGGTAKTTSAIYLALAFHNRGGRLSSSTWTNRVQQPTGLIVLRRPEIHFRSRCTS